MLFILIHMFNSLKTDFQISILQVAQMKSTGQLNIKTAKEICTVSYLLNKFFVYVLKYAFLRRWNQFGGKGIVPCALYYGYESV
jgi:hypothetical protein